MKRLIPFIRLYTGYIAGALFFAAANVALTLLAPVLIGNAIDLIIEVGRVDFAGVARILCILAASVAGASLFSWLMGLCTNALSYYTVRDIRRDIFAKYNSSALDFIDSNSHGDLISRIINDVDALGDGLLQAVTQLFTGITTIIGTLLFMVFINYRIAIAVVLVTPLSLFAAAFIGRLSSKKFREQQQLQGELGGLAEELIGNQSLVKAFCYEEESQSRFDKLNSRLYTVGQKAQFAGSLANPTTRFVNGIVYASVGVIGALGAIGVIGCALSVGQISCFLSYANQYTKPFNEVTGVLTQLQTAMASAKRIFTVLDETKEESNPQNALKLESCRGSIEFKNVGFSYDPSKELIKDLSFSVRAGQRVAIVGPTGCGKTTLINLLMRFYDVTQGEILIDGTDIRRFDLKELRSQYGMVLQDSWLFNGTVMENLRYGNETASEADIIRAAKLSYAHDFIERLPQGYQTVITEEGANLSQGQRQLLCIARVMLTDPPILILDEATSSIDTLTEQRVQSAFAKLMNGRTGFVVAHRLSTIVNSDKILVMNDGDVIEQGTHAQLMQARGFYYELQRASAPQV